MTNTNQTTIEALEELIFVQGLNPIKRKCLLKLDNRKKLENYLSIATLKGFDYFVQTCSPSYENKTIIKEILCQNSEN